MTDRIALDSGPLSLLCHPEQLARLKTEPQLVDSAVDELLRFLSPVQFAPRRVALEDAEIHGAQIRQGDGVFAVNPAANRDPAEFPADLTALLGDPSSLLEAQGAAAAYAREAFSWDRASAEHEALYMELEPE